MKGRIKEYGSNHWKVLQRKDEKAIEKVNEGNCSITLNKVSSCVSQTIAQGVTKRNACSSGYVLIPSCRGKLDISTSIRAKTLTLVFISAPRVATMTEL